MRMTTETRPYVFIIHKVDKAIEKLEDTWDGHNFGVGQIGDKGGLKRSLLMGM